MKAMLLGSTALVRLWHEPIIERWWPYTRSVMGYDYSHEYRREFA